MIWRAGLRGRAPFSCGKKRPLPLKLPLPPKTAHGKARSSRLPPFRAKRHKAGKRQQKYRRRVPPYRPRQQPAGGNSVPYHAMHPGDRQPPQVPLDAPGQRLLRGGRKRTLKDVGVQGKALLLPGSLCFLLPPGRGQAPDKVFWRGGGARGGGRPFCPQKGGLPLAQILSAPTAGDPARAGRWPRPHGRERWRPSPPGRRWCGPDAAHGYTRGRRGPGRARPAP